MPVTAKLSRKFYETFGDDIANELVEWFNQVDATYRLEFRDLFAVNFSRFDAKLEQRIAELRAEFEQRFTALDAKLEQRIAELRADFEQRFTALDAKLEQRIAELRADFEQRFTALDAKLDRVATELRSELKAELALLEGRMVARFGMLEGRSAALETRLLRWLFVFWAANIATTVAMIQLLR